MQSRSRATLALLSGLVAVSLAARIFLLVERPLWHDETFTAWASRLPPSRLIDALRADAGPPLFYLLERPFARAATDPARDPLVRVLPFLAGLGLFAAMRTLPRGAARRWGIALAAGLALSNLYAAEARAYSLLALAIFGVFFFGLVRPESRLSLAALFATAAAALWLHYLALFAVAAALVLALWRRRLRAALALAAAGAAFLPWLPVLFAQPPDAMAWMREAPADALPGFLSALGGVGRIPAPFGAPLPSGVFLAGAVLGVALLVMLFPASKRDDAGRLAAVFVVLTLGLSLAASLWRPVAFAGRCEMVVLGVWIWAVARAAADRPDVRAAAGMAVLIGLGATVFVAFGPHPRSTPASAVQSVVRLARPGDAVLAGPGFVLPALYEAERGRLPARVEALPSGDAAHPGWFVAWPLNPGDVRAALDAAARTPPGARLFLLLPPAYSAPALMDPLAERGVRRELVRQNDGVLTVWTPGADRR